MNFLRSDDNRNASLDAQRIPGNDGGILTEESFCRMISLERKRTERSRKPFLLMLLDALPTEGNERALCRILSALASSTRETDVKGWHKNNSVVGVVFTEIAIEGKNTIVSTIVKRIRGALCTNLTSEQFNQINISFHLFPEDYDHQAPMRPSDPTLYPDLLRREDSKRLSRLMKRSLDILGTLSALIICAPVFLMIAAAIKVSSKGPALFMQKRLGQYGAPFTFLKFRSMYVDNDCSTHKEYVRRLIAGQADRNPSNGSKKSVYKLTADSRITPLGMFLRRTSLDELPQLLNVLKGEMSLVGPRPPIVYEVEAYDIWHRRRILEAKPGITGLWQINGRSRVKFDEMVRLDLRYARTWSPWLDIKILLRTPQAVLSGGGAY